MVMAVIGVGVVTEAETAAGTETATAVTAAANCP